MDSDVIFYRRNLPHIHPKDATFFITFLLAGAIPISVLKRLNDQKNLNIKKIKQNFNEKKLVKEIYNTEMQYFSEFDEYLDCESNGPIWLEEKVIAQIVADKMYALDGVRYKLITYTIMSNHIHVLFNTTGI
jgi:putative transposase